MLGDPDYYGRFALAATSTLGLEAAYAVEMPGAWRVGVFVPGVTGTLAGTVRCAARLAPEHYWREQRALKATPLLESLSVH